MFGNHFSKAGRVALFLSAVLIFTVFNGDAQTAPSSSISTEATSVLVERTKAMIQENRPGELIPLLKEILVRVKGNTDEESLQTRAFCMYQIGACQMRIEQYTDAVKSLAAFINEFPKDPMAAGASLLIAECYARGQDWPAAEKYARTQMDNKSLDSGRRTAALQILAEALYHQEKWLEATKPLKEIFDSEKEQKARNDAAVMLMTAYAKGKDTGSFMAFLNYCDESVRQNAGVNAALIETGDQKRSAGDYAGALVLYRSVLLKADLIDLYGKQMAEIKVFLAKPYVTVVGSSRSAYEEVRRVKQAEYDGKKQALEKIRTGDNFDMDIALRIGQCYVSMKRYWPAYTLFRKMCADSPEHALAEEARFQAFNVALDMQKWDPAIQEAAVYLARYPKGKFADEVSLNLIQVYLQSRQMDQALAAGFKALELSPEHRFKDQVKYLLGYIYFQKLEYAEALKNFQEVFDKRPESIHHEAAEYWIAMSRLFLGQFDQAVTDFKAYLHNESYSSKRFAEDTSYRLGIALYGAGRFQESEQAFKQFLDTYPGSDLKSEACSMMADLRGADGDLDAALALYSKAIECAASIDQINYAVFQSATVYELQKKYDDIIAMMEKYLSEHGAAGNYAGAGFWIGKSYTALGQGEKAIEKYIETIVQFGDKPENDAVDLILRELIKQHDSKEGWGNDAAIKSRVISELKKAERQGKKTLTLRLMTLLTYTSEKAERIRYVDGILSAGDVKDASALTLLLMATEAAGKGDAGRVHEIFRHCMATHAESEIIIDVMNTELQMLVKEGNYQQAIDLAEEITNRFGYRAEVGLTRKLKADAYRLMGQSGDAIKTYQELFAVREWRGPLTPQALYWIGICTYEQGRTEEAFAFFQRVYVLYGSYAEWVAKAYEGSLLCLEKMGRTDDIIRTCREMLANEALASTPEGRRAQARLTKLLPEGGAR